MTDVMVLCYHAVSPGWPSPLAVEPDRFEHHLDVLRGKGFEPATFTEAVIDPPAERTVAITFDDAYRSVFEHAAPLLRSYEMPATVFAPTALVDREVPMSWPGIDRWAAGDHSEEVVPMSWRELAQLQAAGWEIGSHTRTHPRLPELGPDELREQLAGSREECQRNLSAPCRSLAYPYGDYDAGVVEAASEVGYEAAGALMGRTTLSGPMQWPRLAVYRGDDRRRFSAKVSRASRMLHTSRVWQLRMVLRKNRG